MAPLTSFATLNRRMNSFSRMGCVDHHPLTTHSLLHVPLQTSMIGEGYSTHLRTGEITKWNNTKIGLYLSSSRTDAIQLNGSGESIIPSLSSSSSSSSSFSSSAASCSSSTHSTTSLPFLLMGDWQVKSHEVTASKMHISGIVNVLEYAGSIHVYSSIQPQISLQTKQQILCAIYQNKVDRIEIQWRSNQSFGILILRPTKQQHSK